MLALCKAIVNVLRTVPNAVREDMARQKTIAATTKFLDNPKTKVGTEEGNYCRGAQIKFRGLLTLPQDETNDNQRNN